MRQDTAHVITRSSQVLATVAIPADRRTLTLPAACSRVITAGALVTVTADNGDCFFAQPLELVNGALCVRLRHAIDSDATRATIRRAR